MSACGRCGQENPAGATVCNNCATPIAAEAKPASEPGTSSQVHRVVFTPQPAGPKLVKRTTPTASTAMGSSRGGIQWIPWSEMSGGQKVGRAVAILLAVLVVLFLMRTFFGGAKSSVETMINAHPESNEPPLTDADRADGLVSLCQTLKIYGIPKDDNEAADVARHSEDLFKLPGDRSVARSTFILTTLAEQFRSGALTMSSCPQHPTPAAEQTPWAIPSPAK